MQCFNHANLKWNAFYLTIDLPAISLNSQGLPVLPTKTNVFQQLMIDSHLNCTDSHCTIMFLNSYMLEFLKTWDFLCIINAYHCKKNEWSCQKSATLVNKFLILSINCRFWTRYKFNLGMENKIWQIKRKTFKFWQEHSFFLQWYAFIMQKTSILGIPLLFQNIPKTFLLLSPLSIEKLWDF